MSKMTATQDAGHPRLRRTKMADAKPTADWLTEVPYGRVRQIAEWIEAGAGWQGGGALSRAHNLLKMISLVYFGYYTNYIAYFGVSHDLAHFSNISISSERWIEKRPSSKFAQPLGLRDCTWDRNTAVGSRDCRYEILHDRCTDARWCAISIQPLCWCKSYVDIMAVCCQHSSDRRC